MSASWVARATTGFRNVNPRLLRLWLPLLLALLLAAAYGAGLARLPAAHFPSAGAVAVFVAATISSTAGFAFSALCAPMLALAEPDPVRLVQTLMVSSIAIQAWCVWAMRGALRPRDLAPFLLGGLLTLPAGVWLLLHAGQHSHARLLGGVILAYGLFTLFRPPLRLRRPGRVWQHLLAGAGGGFTGALAAFPSAGVTIWCAMEGWPKERQRAVVQPYILTMQVAALGLMPAMGGDLHARGHVDAITLAYMPPALLGAALGLRLFHGVSDAAFGRIVNALLVASGLALLR